MPLNRFFSILAFILGCSTSNVGAQDMPPSLDSLINLDLQWAGTGVTLDRVISKLSDEFCYQDLRTFLSCIHAANMVVRSNPDFRKPRIIGASFESLLKQNQNLEELKVPREDRGQERRARWIQFSKVFESVTFKDLDSWVKLDLRLRNSEVDEYIKLFKQPKSEHINFKSTFEWIKSITTGWSHYAAQVMINAVYAVMLDPHSLIQLRGKIAKDLDRSNLKNTDLGIRIDLLPYPRVKRVFKGSGAWNAGVRRNDILTSFDQKNIDDLSISAFLNSFATVPESQISVTVNRGGEQIQKLVRVSPYDSSDFETENISSTELGLALTRLTLHLFSFDACRKVKEAIEHTPPESKGYILDLRGNLGGSLDAALCIADLFAGAEGKKWLELESVILSAAPKVSAPAKSIRQSNSKAITSLPLLILVDSDSASASEVLTGVLATENRALTLGTLTFGKGLVQELQKSSEKLPFFDFSPKNVEFKRTIAVYHFSSGEIVDKRGIQPDFEVPVEKNANDVKSKHAREIDWYPFPRLAVKADIQALKFNHPIEDIAQCMNTKGIHPDEIFSTRLKSDENADLQMIHAEKAMQCMVQ